MNKYSQISGLAEAEIEALTAEGIEVTPADIVEINALSLDVESPQNRVDMARGTPVFAGDTPLWPMTMQAGEWVLRVGGSMFTGRLKNDAISYAMAHCYKDGNHFDISGLKAAWTITKFINGLKCTHDMLLIATAEVINQSEAPEMPPDENSKDGLTLGELSCFLASISNESADFWERRCSIEYACNALNTIVQQNNADNRPSDSDPRIQAEQALGWCIEKIRQRAADNG